MMFLQCCQLVLTSVNPSVTTVEGLQVTSQQAGVSVVTPPEWQKDYALLSGSVCISSWTQL